VNFRVSPRSLLPFADRQIAAPALIIVHFK
jgi:hypothetical protein